MKEESREDPKACWTCKHYAQFEGVCCCPDSDHRADFVDGDFCCKHWEAVADD